MEFFVQSEFESIPFFAWKVRPSSVFVKKYINKYKKTGISEHIGGRIGGNSKQA